METIKIQLTIAILAVCLCFIALATLIAEDVIIDSQKLNSSDVDKYIEQTCDTAPYYESVGKIDGEIIFKIKCDDYQEAN